MKYGTTTTAAAAARIDKGRLVRPYDRYHHHVTSRHETLLDDPDDGDSTIVYHENEWSLSQESIAIASSDGFDHRRLSQHQQQQQQQQEQRWEQSTYTNTLQQQQQQQKETRHTAALIPRRERRRRRLECKLRRVAEEQQQQQQQEAEAEELLTTKGNKTGIHIEGGKNNMITITTTTREENDGEGGEPESAITDLTIDDGFSSLQALLSLQYSQPDHGEVGWETECSQNGEATDTMCDQQDRPNIDGHSTKDQVKNLDEIHQGERTADLKSILKENEGESECELHPPNTDQQVENIGLLLSPPDFDAVARDDYDDCHLQIDLGVRGGGSYQRHSPISLRVRDRNSKIAIDENGGGTSSSYCPNTTSRKRKSIDSVRNEKENRTRNKLQLLDNTPSNVQFGQQILRSGGPRQFHSLRECDTDTASEQRYPSLGHSDTTNLENVKTSIVGVRPSRWATKPLSTTRMMTQKSTPASSNASTLSAATRIPLLKPSKMTRSRSYFGSRCVDQSATREAVAAKAHQSTDGATVLEGMNDIANVVQSSSAQNARMSFSFAPLFVPSRPSNLFSVDGLVEDERDVVNCPAIGGAVSSANSGVNFDYHSSPNPNMGRRRRSKACNGPWVRRLTSLQTMRGNDSFRLQNEVFARRTVVDVNDPRKRANTYVDVTLVGQYDGPWVDLPEDYKITLLGYAHRHVQKKKTGMQQRQPVTFLSEGTLSWFTFTLTTARNVSLHQSRFLRIYNPVILPCPSTKVLNIPWPHSRVDGNVNLDGYCATHVICTHLCERLDSIPPY